MCDYRGLTYFKSINSNCLDSIFYVIHHEASLGYKIFPYLAAQSWMRRDPNSDLTEP